MDIRKVPANDPEQQWITKYREAMNAAAIPIHQPLGGNIRDAVASTYVLLTSKVVGFLKHRMHHVQVRPVVSVSNMQKLAIPPRGIPQATPEADTRTRAS
jgi:hypothetical protein